MELYIHIPFCMKKCAYCDFLSGSYDRTIRSKYTDALCREISYYGSRFEGGVETVFIGGGTPSWLEIPLMERIVKAAGEAFSIDDAAEFTIEVNPGTVTRDAMEAYASWGINRVSIGLQSANDGELKLLGRVHNYEHFLKTFEITRNCGIKNINVDLMTGLPGQTPDVLLRSLRQVAMLRPEHISAYSLMIEEGTPFYELYGEDARRQAAGEITVYLPEEEELCELCDLTEETLAGYGYRQYEISNYAKKGFECRHNLGYWRRVPYLGVGLGAASFYGHTRYTNEQNMYRYLDNPVSREEQPLLRNDEIAEFMYLGLRTTEGVSRKAFEETFGAALLDIYGDVLIELSRDGFVEARAGRVFLTKRGRDVSNVILAKFLLEEEQEGQMGITGH